MNVLFELLFNAWCAPYSPQRMPPHLRGDPVKAYGQYAFQRGFQLALELAVTCLDPEDLARLDGTEK